MITGIKNYFTRRNWRKHIKIGDIVLVKVSPSEKKMMRVVSLPNPKDARVGVYTVSTSYKLYPLCKIYKCESEQHGAPLFRRIRGNKGM